jgi:hypothetical protein
MTNGYGAIIVLFVIIAVIAFALAGEWKKEKKDKP